MSIFYTSDLHLGHVRCATEFRGFSSVDEHNKIIVERWNDTVTNTDVVYIVGDLCMGKLDESLPLAKSLRGVKYLIPGNHDRMHPAYHHKGDDEERRAKRWAWGQRYWHEAGVVLMPLQCMFWHRPQPFMVCHFPYSDDHEEYANEPRYPEYRPVDDGVQRLVHGHIHDMRRETIDKRQVNVGIDMWDFAPIEHDHLMEVMGW
jgi:calcineurin-like phosphoesterase family protein